MVDSPLTDKDLLEKVLQLVPLEQRLTSCALVNSAWRAAVDAATTDIHAYLEGESVAAFNTWLQQHPNKAAIRSIRLSAYHSKGLVLPVSQLPSLQQLELYSFGWSATLDSPQPPSAAVRRSSRLASSSTNRHGVARSRPASSSAQILPLRALTGLTRLELARDSVVQGKLQHLPYLTALKELDCPMAHSRLLRRRCRRCRASRG